MADGWPSAIVAHPLHPDIQVYCTGEARMVRRNGGAQTLRVEYSGPTDLLIESGIATAEMLSGNQVGRARVDVDGHHFRIARTSRASGQHYCRIAFFKPVDVVKRMPGVREAIAAYEHTSEWMEERSSRRQLADAKAVVDSMLTRFSKP
jgi:hypothetical protein